MNTKTITTGITSAALLFSSLVPMAFADSSFTISGNGSHSSNSIAADFTNTAVVSQTNNTDVTNDVNINNNTGFNNASGNTGGNVNLETGDASATVAIHNMAGSNVAHVGDLCGCDSNTDARISGNGYGSDNSIDIAKDNLFVLDQRNDTTFDNHVDISNNTGYNDANDNTGGDNVPWWFEKYNHDTNGGDVRLSTGDAYADVFLHNMAGSNVFH